VDDPFWPAGQRVDTEHDISQFVGGETWKNGPVARKLGEYHVQVILDYGVEGGMKEKKVSSMPVGSLSG